MQRPEFRTTFSWNEIVDMKPLRAFLFLSCVLILLFLISFYHSKRNQEYSHVPVYQSISSDIRQKQDRPALTKTAIDSALVDSTTAILPDPSPSADTIHNPENRKSKLLFAPGDSLRLQKLSTMLAAIRSDSLQVRILYYGDSQIEGDHITSSLRKKLQKRFGGRGPGLIAPDQYYNPPHQLIMTLSDNWQTWLTKDQNIKNRSIIFRNTLSVSNPDVSWFRVNRLRFLNPQEDFEQFRIFGYARDTTQVKLFSSAKLALQQNIDSINRICCITKNFDQTPDDLKITLSSADSLWITGISLESKSGVFVDNIALRGLSYPPFIRSDQQSMLVMFRQIHPAMFILQFGVNVVPYDSDNYANFRYQFRRQIRWMKQVFPQTPILIIGVSDMAHRVDGEFVSYENIQRIKQIQYEIAMKNQCIFWDLERFMGGPGSMVRWVDSSPSLGRKDYVHFSEKGAERIGTELAKLLMEELDNSLQKGWENN